jgi:hypothetical protein
MWYPGCLSDIWCVTCILLLALELCQEVSQHDVQTVNQLLPVLQRRLSEATQGFADCLNIKEPMSGKIFRCYREYNYMREYIYGLVQLMEQFHEYLGATLERKS